MNELAIPCSDCGTALAENTVHTRDIPVVTALRGTVRVADCPSCGARYYPRQALSKLSRAGTDGVQRGEN